MLGALCLVEIDFACDLNRLFVLAWMDDVFHPYWHNLAHRIYWVVLFRSHSSTMRRRCSARVGCWKGSGAFNDSIFSYASFVGGKCMVLPQCRLVQVILALGLCGKSNLHPKWSSRRDG